MATKHNLTSFVQARNLIKMYNGVYYLTSFYGVN